MESKEKKNTYINALPSLINWKIIIEKGKQIGNAMYDLFKYLFMFQDYGKKIIAL